MVNIKYIAVTSTKTNVQEIRLYMSVLLKPISCVAAIFSELLQATIKILFGLKHGL